MENDLSRRDFIKLAAGSTAALLLAEFGATGSVSAAELIQKRDRKFFSVPEVSPTEGEFAALTELNSGASPELLGQEVKLNQIDGHVMVQDFELTPGSELSTQVDHALNFINGFIAPTLQSTESLSGVCGLNLVTSKSEQGENQVAVVIDIRRDVKIGQPTLLAGALVSNHNGELHYINPSDRVPGSSVKLIQVDQNFIDSTATANQEAGYNSLYNFDSFRVGDLAMVETAPGLGDQERIVQLIAIDGTLFYDAQVLTGSAIMRLRTAPTLQGAVAFEKAQLNDEQIIRPSQLVNLDATSLAAIGLKPEDVVNNLDKTSIMVNADGYQWTLINYNNQALWVGFSANEALQPEMVSFGAPTPQPVEFVRAGLEAFDFRTAEFSYGYGLDKKTVDQLIQEAGGINTNVRPLYWKPGERVPVNQVRFLPLSPEYNFHDQYENNDTHILEASLFYVGQFTPIADGTHFCVFAAINPDNHSVSFLSLGVDDNNMEEKFNMVVEVNSSLEEATQKAPQGLTPLAEGLPVYAWNHPTTNSDFYNYVFNRLIPGQQVLIYHGVGGAEMTKHNFTTTAEKLSARQPFTGVERLGFGWPNTIIAFATQTNQA